MSRYDVMLSYVPLYYHTSDFFRGILSVEGQELDSLRKSIDDLMAQFYVDTATWGLEFWDKEYAIKASPAIGIEERRSQIKGKVRGVGTVGSELIKSLGIAYSNGEVDLSFEGSTLTITFVGIRGIPTALEELKKQLNEVIPAHLVLAFKFTYLTWSEFDLLSAVVQESMTWGQLEIYKPFLKENVELMWDEFDVLAPEVQESMIWDEIEVYEP
ncbi:MAG: YmfQ family protein [Clostridia bacterium]|nr:YmfQ family protein [Clostridia bacterium]